MRYKLTYTQEFNRKCNLKGHQVIIQAEEVKKCGILYVKTKIMDLRPQVLNMVWRK